MKPEKIRAIISGGGTGGHIFPAISIADRLKELNPDNEILFVGAEGKMEMEKVPAAGYDIIGLPVVGLQRRLTVKNIVNDLGAPFKLLASRRKARKILKSFRPDIAIGVGGYASAPLLQAAVSMGIPSVIQEQNGFAGLTNKMLAKKVLRICVAYEGMERFFPPEKIVLTGNPIRKEIVPATPETKAEALKFYGLDKVRKYIFIVGGSLGSGTLNNAVKKWIGEGCPGGENIGVLWQCGRYYKQETDAFMSGHASGIPAQIIYTDFIGRMDLAYAAADIVISRSGASSISELCAARKACIFVPSPNVAEDHQTHNAMALVKKDAAIIVKDADAEEKLMSEAIGLLGDEDRIAAMEKNIAALAITDAADRICKEIYDVLGKKESAAYENVYFIGIGGIGMSAIARYYKFKGLNVSGYDRTPSELTRELEKEGIPVHYEDDPSRIPADPAKTLVAYTPAVPDDFGELVYVREHGYRVIKRSRMLGEIAEGQRCLAVAGTHGKTTTSTLTAHILTESGAGCSAFLGGISKNYGSNLLISRNPVIVAEADEFDRSFLQLHPETAVITAMDADHLDIYGDLQHVHEAFKAFASQVSGTVIAKLGTDITEKDTAARILRYHIDDRTADFHGENICTDESGYPVFDLHYPGGEIKGIRVGVPGRVNVENSIAAAAICLTNGVEPEAVRHAIGSFLGVRRRMDIHLHTPSLSYVDDYAHHPQEIASTLSSMREIFPDRKITAIFQPHLYSRTRDFADGFAEALDKADKVILLDIYPARELPIPGVSSEIILDKIQSAEKMLVPKDELLNVLQKEDIDVLVTFGAGDIGGFTGPITEMLKERLAE